MMARTLILESSIEAIMRFSYSVLSFVRFMFVTCYTLSRIAVLGGVTRPFSDQINIACVPPLAG